MASRLDLQSKLGELLGNRNVYYRPPATLSMNYPAIKYSKMNIETTFANDAMYVKRNQYEIIVIDEKSDNPVIDKLLKLPYCSFNRHYNSDNLSHDVFILYY